MMRSTQRSRARRWLVGFTTLVLVAAAGLLPVAAVAAPDPNNDMVLTWNRYAVNALSNPLPTAIPTPEDPGANLPPPVASIHLAMVQGAVYDAVNAIDGGHEPYFGGLSAPAGASKAAAAATAAYDVLVGFRRPAPVPPGGAPVPVLPSDVLANLLVRYNASIAAITESGVAAGVEVGHAAALVMRDRRADDGRFGPFRFPAVAPFHPGQWRPELPSNVNDPNAWVAEVTPFTLTSTSQFRTAGPLDMTSPEYAAEFNEVKALGAATGSTRTASQTQLARFYAANPLPMQNAAFREIAAGQGLSLTEDARLFVMSSMSSADALINCWDDKAFWNFWRPITAIREAADDGNPATQPVPVTDPPTPWMPYIGTFVASGTPPYPDHPSGYNCFTAAMMNTAAIYFRTEKVTVHLYSPITDSIITYKRPTAVLKDTIDARIYLGIHFRNPDVQGAWLGKKVAKWVDKHYFQPVN